MQYLKIDLDELINLEDNQEQTSLFDEPKEEKESLENEAYCYCISKLHLKLTNALEEIGSLKLFNEIEMPLVEILAEMQYVGVYADENEIYKFGQSLKGNLEELRIDIFNLAGEEFNINSTQQLGKILFEKLKLPVYKKTKTGYSTDNEVLEKLKSEHPIIEKILDYRQITKLNSTYVEGLIPHINEKTGRIHTYFHQTATATGRLSSSEPNLQNIPTRTELGKKVRKVFKPDSGKIFVDADYSQIELRVLAHISGDEIMVNAFRENQDIHTICASKIFNVPVENVSKQLRSRAKAVNFGIVYGISEFGLAEQTGINRKEAKDFMEQYLNTYSGIKKYMEDIVEEAKAKGYIDTLFGRRRYIPELKSNNYMVRKFGERVAMNTKVQGTAADIMKIAMINVYKKLKEEGLKSKIVLQIHDELLVEAPLEEKERVKEILVSEMENVCNLSVPLKVEAEEGKNWLAAK
jgi:DNA polymerase-1